MDVTSFNINEKKKKKLLSTLWEIFLLFCLFFGTNIFDKFVIILHVSTFFFPVKLNNI